MANHILNEIAARAMLGEWAAITSYESNLKNDRFFGGQEYSRASCIAVNAGGESVTVIVPGTIAGLTPESVVQRVSKLDFPRVRFEGLTIEIKGGEYNRVTFTGIATKAELYTPATTTK